MTRKQAIGRLRVTSCGHDTRTGSDAPLMADSLVDALAVLGLLTLEPEPPPAPLVHIRDATDAACMISEDHMVAALRARGFRVNRPPC